MTRQTRNRLFSLLILLGVLAGILATPAEQNAYAWICCEACQGLYERCVEKGGGGCIPGDGICCAIRYDSCFMTCTYC